MINYKLKIDCQGDKVLSSDIVFVSGDVKAYQLTFEFRDGENFIDTKDCILTVRARRADGSCVEGAGEIVDGKGIYIPQNNIYAVPGELRMEIALCDSAKSYITTKIIVAEVLEGIGDSCKPEETEVSVFVGLLNQLQTRINAVRKIAEESIPVKGVNYWTPEDQAEIMQFVDERTDKKLGVWLPDTEYHAGDIVLAQYAKTDEAAQNNGEYTTVCLLCIKDHTSSGTAFLLPCDSEYWDMANAQSVHSEKDAMGRIISEYYAGKDEVERQIGDIETALDAIYEIQNSLIGGDV